MSLWKRAASILLPGIILAGCVTLPKFGAPVPPPIAPEIIASPIVDSQSDKPSYPKPYCVNYTQAQQDKIATALASLPRDNVLIGAMSDYHTMRAKAGCVKS
jgi:hypothetical protein